ncbi:hypothetical protein [Streptomyces hygroscopicus]|uniref:hypothetical protein n=1 Tax=Streptomyces hygroscopicus TaxID=1912 RepID=UPI000767CDC0|nr:hypothetical protein [Streptomyces hygroscopicus]
MSAQDTYLGWEALEHRPDCQRPSWEVDVRTERGGRDLRSYSDDQRRKHSCPDEYCGHGNTFDRITVRIVCRSCGLAHLISGEESEDTGRTSTGVKHLGYGMEPRRIAGLYLWPGEPWLAYGRAVSDEPHDFLVTRTRVDRVTAADVVGQILQGRGGRGAVRWSANAVANPEGQYGLGQLRFDQATEGLRSVAAAAKWIAAALQDAGGESR